MKTENRVCSGLRLFLAVALAFSFIFTFSSQAIAKNKTVAKETAPKVVTVRSVSVKTEAQAMPSAVETSLQTVPTIDVGLVVAQFSAEITTEADFIVEQPEGQRTVLPKGKYFAAVEQGKIRLGEVLFPGGILLEMPFNEKEAANKKLFSVNRQAYRGRLQIFVTEDGKNLTVVNQVPLEDYVNSVLGPQSSPIWPDEAIKAQAVAVRSLARYHMENRENALFAVRAVETDAFYGGVRTENKNISKVAALTAGEVLYYGNHAAAAYSGESSGGQTVSAVEALQQDIPYLPAVEDFDMDAPSFQWEKKIQVLTIARILNQNGYKVGKLQGYRLTDSGKAAGGDRFSSGRVRSIYWQGDEGSVTLTGQKFAGLLSLNSTWFEVYNVEPAPDKLDVPIENGYGIQIGKKEIPIEIKGPDGSTWKSVLPGFHFLNGSQEETLLFKGKGRGRGLGLSKWGARGMANEAPENAKEYYKTILLHYYPGTRLVELY